MKIHSAAHDLLHADRQTDMVKSTRISCKFIGNTPKTDNDHGKALSTDTASLNKIKMSDLTNY